MLTLHFVCKSIPSIGLPITEILTSLNDRGSKKNKSVELGMAGDFGTSISGRLHAFGGVKGGPMHMLQNHYLGDWRLQYKRWFRIESSETI